MGGVDTTTRVQLGGAGRLVLPALFAAAITLRPQIVGVGPLVPAIRTDLGVSFLWAGLLTTIPVLCMGLFAPLVSPVVRRIGAARGVAIASLAIAATGTARAVAPGATGVLATTVAVGVAVALAGTLLPVVVKQGFATRPLTATGVYVAGIQTGAASSALVAVPLADLTGGWRGSLLVLSLASLLVAVPWVMIGRTLVAAEPAPAVLDGPQSARSRRIPALVRLATLFALQSVPFYGLIAWLPSHLVDAGWTEARAGAALALLNVVGLATSLTVPRLGDRIGSRRGYLWVGAGLAATAVVGLVVAPAAGYLLAMAAGVGLSVLFTVTLTLPLDAAPDVPSAAIASSVVLGAGYTVAAGVPALLGALRDWTGGFEAALGVLLASLLTLAVLATGAPEPVRHHRR